MYQYLSPSWCACILVPAGVPVFWSQLVCLYLGLSWCACILVLAGVPVSWSQLVCLYLGPSWCACILGPIYTYPDTFINVYFECVYNLFTRKRLKRSMYVFIEYPLRYLFTKYPHSLICFRRFRVNSLCKRLQKYTFSRVSGYV